MVEFTYNSSINRSIDRSPFECVTSALPRKPIDLVPLSNTAHPSVEADAFAKHICDIYDEIRRRIAMSNESYKTHADLKRQFAEFEEGDMVMVQIKPESYPKGTYKKLHSRSAGPYKVLKKINSNVYVLDLPKDMGISNVFNVEDLTMYHYNDDVKFAGATTIHLPPAPRLKEEIEDIVNHQVVSIRSGGYEKYLMKWKGHPLSNCTWITDEELIALDYDLYDKFHAFNLSGSSSFKLARDDEGPWQQPLKTYKRHPKTFN